MKPKVTVKLLKGHPPDEAADFSAEYASVPGVEHVAWSDLHWTWKAITWNWEFHPRPRGYVSARKKKTRRERRWRRRNRK